MCLPSERLVFHTLPRETGFLIRSAWEIHSLVRENSGVELLSLSLPVLIRGSLGPASKLISYRRLVVGSGCLAKTAVLQNANPHLSVLGGERSTWAPGVSGKLPHLSCLPSGDALVGVALTEWWSWGWRVGPVGKGTCPQA